jgi:hypothetical protein
MKNKNKTAAGLESLTGGEGRGDPPSPYCTGFYCSRLFMFYVLCFMFYVSYFLFVISRLRPYF